MSFLASVHIKSRTGYAQDIRTGRHELIADEPETLGGRDEGPAPFQLVLSGLAACTSITLTMYAAKKGWQLGPLAIDLRLSQEGDTRHVQRTITFAAQLTEEQRTRLLEIAEKTPVTRALREGFSIATSAAPR